MIFKSYVARMNEREQWHRWFAWYPVTLGSWLGRGNRTVWLQWVERRVECWHDQETWPSYGYRLPLDTKALDKPSPSEAE